jgi:hypothetical protein
MKMPSSTLRDIERSIRALPLPEQLWLLERLVGCVREQTGAAWHFDMSDVEEPLAAMANDPAIQRELKTIAPAAPLTLVRGFAIVFV